MTWRYVIHKESRSIFVMWGGGWVNVTPHIWLEGGAFWFATINPDPNDVAPKIPGGPFKSMSEALDVLGDFFNHTDIGGFTRSGRPRRINGTPEDWLCESA